MTNRRRRKAGEELPAALGESTGFLLSKAAQLVRERFENRLCARDLTAQQVGILSLVSSRTVATQREIGKALRIDRTTMVYLVDRLEEMRLLERQDNAADRRSYAVKITSAGTGALKKAMNDARRVENDVLRDFSERDLRTLRRILSRIAKLGAENGGER